MSNLVPLNSPVLHRPASPIAEDEFGTKPLAAAIDQLGESFDVFFKAYKGVGLAAPQIGIPWRLAVAEDYGLRPTSPRWQHDLVRRPFARIIMCNPTIAWASDEQIFARETCLSEADVVGLVERPREMQIEYRSSRGAAQSLVAQDWAARILSHEVDHLFGCLCSQRYLPGSSMATDQYTREWKDRPLSDALRAFRAG